MKNLLSCISVTAQIFFFCLIPLWVFSKSKRLAMGLVYNPSNLNSSTHSFWCLETVKMEHLWTYGEKKKEKWVSTSLKITNWALSLKTQEESCLGLIPWAKRHTHQANLIGYFPSFTSPFLASCHHSQTLERYVRYKMQVLQAQCHGFAGATA